MRKPLILAKLQAELSKPEAAAYVTERLEKEVKKALAGRPRNSAERRKRLEQERRKLQNLVTALAEGGSSSAAVLVAIAEKRRPSLSLNASWQPLLLSGQTSRSRTSKDG